MPNVIAGPVEGTVGLTFGPGSASFSVAPSAGATSVTVTNGAIFAAGGIMLIWDTGTSEVVRVLAVAGNTLTTSPLASGHGTVNVVPGKVSSGGSGPRSPYLAGG